MSSHRGATRLIIPVPPTLDRWELEDEDMPETVLHELIIGLLVDILRAWAEQGERDALVGSNLAMRFDREHPTRGVDPDVYVVEPCPPEGEATKSLRLWEKGHHPPRVAIEVVSENTARKDYDHSDGPARYAACGARELWVFDPLRLGPSDDGGPWVLQVWRRTAKGAFRRVYQGDGPAFSRELAAWIVTTDDGARLRIADDAAGSRLWPTARERAEAEAASLRAQLDALKPKRATAKRRGR